MFFAQTRIAMNDAYVALFVVAAVRSSPPSGPAGAGGERSGSGCRGRPAARPRARLEVGRPLRHRRCRAPDPPALGPGAGPHRVGLGAISGHPGLPGDRTGPNQLATNNLFLLLMVGLTIPCRRRDVLHPVGWTVEEVRFAVAAPVAAGAPIGLLAILLLGTGAVPPERAPVMGAPVVLMAVGGVAAGPSPSPAGSASARSLRPRARRPGRAPRARRPAPDGWLRPGWLAAASRSPGRSSASSRSRSSSTSRRTCRGSPSATRSWPAGRRATRPDADRPDPRDVRVPQQPAGDARRPRRRGGPGRLDLKPVWFYQGSFAGPTVGAIYDGGNLVLFWLSIPAFAFVAWQAWRRRSLALTLVVIMFACLWLPWARIDRATFQYHYYTALPFVILALAYFLRRAVARALRGGRGCLARVAAAARSCAPVVDVAPAGPRSAHDRRRAGEPGLAGLLAAPRRCRSRCRRSSPRHPRRPRGGRRLLVWQLLALDRTARADEAAPDRARLARLAVTGAMGLPLLVVAWIDPAGDAADRLPSVPGEVLAARPPRGPGARWPTSSGRRPRHAASPSAPCWSPPSSSSSSTRTSPACRSRPAIYNWYQGLLPTWLYPFQFPVNTDPPVTVSLVGPWPLHPLRARRARGAAFVGLRGVCAWRLGARAGQRRPTSTPPARPDLTGRPALQSPAGAAGEPCGGSGGTSAVKCGGSVPWAARRRITNP